MPEGLCQCLCPVPCCLFGRDGQQVSEDDAALCPAALLPLKARQHTCLHCLSDALKVGVVAPLVCQHVKVQGV